MAAGRKLVRGIWLQSEVEAVQNGVRKEDLPQPSLSDFPEDRLERGSTMRMRQEYGLPLPKELHTPEHLKPEWLRGVSGGGPRAKIDAGWKDKVWPGDHR